MSITAKKEQTQRAKSLKGKLTTTAVALLITLIAVVSATYAWYIYNTGRHTTKVRMAAGTGVNLQISNVYKDGYKSAAMLESFSGKLNPVSTNRIEGGFQKVIGFTNGSENQSNLVANLFGKSEYSERYKDYYKTSLFLRSNGKATDIYISDISFQDSDEKIPISSAIRVGFVILELPQPTNVGWGFLRAFARYPLVQLMGVPTENKPVFRNVFVCWRKSDIPVHPAPCPLIQLTSTK